MEDFLKALIATVVVISVFAIAYNLSPLREQAAEASTYGAYNPIEKTNVLLERQANALNRIAAALEKIAGRK